jgi:hypothetical protein
VQSGGIGPCFGHSGGTGEFWLLLFFVKLAVCSSLNVSVEEEEGDDESCEGFSSDCVKVSGLLGSRMLSLSSEVKV